MAKHKVDHLGGGRWDAYRVTKKSFWERVGEVIGGVILFMIVIGVIGAIFG